MQIKPEEEVQGVVKTLKEAGKNRLAECISQNWNKTALEYSKELNSWTPNKGMEKELFVAFQKELLRLDTSEALQNRILTSIEKRRTLQTAPHLGATESPRMLCINWLGSLGVEDEDFYVVGMFSGVPFSNKSRPGRINKKNIDINLFPSNLQDGLVYRSTIQEKLLESVSKLSSGLLQFLPKAILGESYTKWALTMCQNIESQILNKQNLVYLDLNEVTSEYLVQVLENKDHIFYKIFFDPEPRTEFMQAFPSEIMFYAPANDGKFERMENFCLASDTLKSKTREISLTNPDTLIKELRDGRLCPGLIVSFLAIAFLNEFKCFGSFAQVEYLPVYQEKLAKLSFLKGFDISRVPTSNLTTGVFPAQEDLYPADIIEGANFKPNEEVLFGELLLPMKDVLLESYFTGDARKK